MCILASIENAVPITITACLIAAVLVPLWFFQKRKAEESEAEQERLQGEARPGHALRIWSFFFIFWPSLCLVFAGIIGCQPGRSAEERFRGIAFALSAVLFFTVGMHILRRVLTERRYATRLTTAAVVSEGKMIHDGKDIFFPEFEFQAGGRSCRVTAASGTGFRLVEKGKKVDLYYAPKDPSVFYVPALQRHNIRISVFLCGIGMVLPLIGLFAPQFRAFISF